MVWWHNRTLTYSIKQNPANVFVARFNPITNLRIGPALWIVWFNMSRVEDARKKGEKTSIINIDGNHLAFWEHFGLQIRDAHAGWLSSRVSPRCCFFFATFFLGRGSLFFFFSFSFLFSLFFSPYALKSSYIWTSVVWMAIPLTYTVGYAAVRARFPLLVSSAPESWPLKKMIKIFLKKRREGK